MLIFNLLFDLEMSCKRTEWDATKTPISHNMYMNFNNIDSICFDLFLVKASSSFVIK